ncbi:hypothetical protein BCR44DRAFT_347948 [Catenaria anguillulae PL171]|uniref:Ankyrin repeat-containing domain protein n=1 Tax=Catenaria anguillulae PL171 TaxID=765915 RepID=A0A1Y2I6P8_9FUNG|nr:hypothetical protein BCR44DRAFT_347948 [Catenaria anguillulae PL171]
MKYTAMMTPRNESAPRLIVELTDQVLVYAIRLSVGATHDYRRTWHDLRSIHTHLMAADPEAHRIDLIRAAIVSAWWLDLNWASERGEVHLLDHMLDLHRAGKRPLQYSRHGLDRAAEMGFLDVVKWWYARKTEQRMWFPDVGPAHLGRGLVLVSNQGSGLTEDDVDRLLEWAVEHICTNDTAPGPHFTDTVESIVTSAIQSGNQRILNCLSRHLQPNQARLLLTYHTSLKFQITRLPGKYKQAWAIEWIASNMPHFDLESCHLHALIGSFGSGDVEWVQWCLKEWRRHAQVGGNPLPEPFVTDLTTCLEVASLAGHLELIEWIADQFLSLRTNGRFAIRLDQIALQGHLHVAQWWKQVGMEVFPHVYFLSKTRNIIYQLTEHGLTELVQWWVTSSDLPFESGETPIMSAAKFGNVELLSWWDAVVRSGGCKNSRTMRFTLAALEIACVHGQVEVLEWWNKHGKPFPQPLAYGASRLVGRMCQCGQLGALKWWYKHIMDATNHAVSTCIWTDKDSLRRLMKEAQSTQLDVFEWLADLFTGQFGKPSAWLHMRDYTTIHPLLVKYYLRQGYLVRLSERGLHHLVNKCISKGYVLVLDDLQRQLDTLPLANMPSSALRIRHKFGRQMCVVDYLARQHGVKWRANDRLILHYLLDNPAVFALEWMEQVQPRIELPPMTHILPQANQSYQFRDGGLLIASRKWVERRLLEEEGKVSSKSIAHVH